MTRTQIAFRLDAEKASQFKQRVEAEGKSLNVVLESLVKLYLDGKLSDQNNELTTEDDDAFPLLTERITQLEKQLTPITELLAVTATDQDQLASGDKVVTNQSRGYFGLAVNRLLADDNSKNETKKINTNQIFHWLTPDEMVTHLQNQGIFIKSKKSLSDATRKGEKTKNGTRFWFKGVSIERRQVGKQRYEYRCVDSDIQEMKPEKTPKATKKEAIDDGKWLTLGEMAEKVNFEKKGLKIQSLKEMILKKFRELGGKSVTVAYGGFLFLVQRETRVDGKTHPNSIRVKLNRNQ